MKLPISNRTKRKLLNLRSRILRGISEPFGVGRFSKVALNDLDDLLWPFVGKKKGYFVEVGGNDGITQSNTYYLEKIHDWTGVLVEPIPDLFVACRRNRRRSKVFNCALVPEGYSSEKITIHYANLMSCVEGALKTDKAQVEQIQKGIELQGLDGTYELKIVARTLTSILVESGTPRDFDFFSLDVEGFEPQVLQGLDLERFRPRYILVESRFPVEVNRLLLEKYELIGEITSMDNLYRRKPI